MAIRIARLPKHSTLWLVSHGRHRTAPPSPLPVPVVNLSLSAKMTPPATRSRTYDMMIGLAIDFLAILLDFTTQATAKRVPPHS